jgi:small-conductance mechanosensitive channel
MILTQWFRELAGLVTKRHLLNLATALLILLIGLFIARRARMAIERFSQLDNQQRLLLSKVAYYGLLGAAIAAGLGQLGFDVRVLLGAAGVLTVAIGFAAQTSASNLISGLFLMIEKPFVVGDIVAVGDIRGEVTAIDMLSCKIRTFTNLMVRIPNETMVKSNITNYSYYPIRRLDLNIGIGYNSDIAKVERLLRDVATHNPLCLDEPKPVFYFTGFGDSSMNIQFQVWTLTENVVRLQNEIYSQIKRDFDREGIDIPFPTRTLITTNLAGTAGAH